MNVSLTDELEAMVHDKVRSGMYNSASEVVREALRLLHERDTLREARLAELRKDVAEGLADMEAGRLKPLDIEAIKSEARRRRSRKRA